MTSQVVSLGAGFDTTYWRLKATGDPRQTPDYYVEIDFESSVAQKLAIIAATPELQTHLAAPNPNCFNIAYADSCSSGSASSSSSSSSSSSTPS